jgi:hypothetical protein
MKKSGLWKGVISFVLIPLGISLLLFNILVFINPATTKHLKYRTYTIEYKQYWKGQKILHPGHAVNNKDLFKQANLILANRLMEEYLRTNDSTLPKKITGLANTFNLNFANPHFEFADILLNQKVILDTTLNDE